MIVQAIATKGDKLAKDTLQVFYSEKTDYQITVGKLYTVYGIFMWRRIVFYIVFDDSFCNPWPHPAELYKIVDNRIPPNWYFNFYGYDSKNEINAVWGYKELTLNKENYDELMDREPEVLDIFFIRQKEIDDFHNIPNQI